MYMLTNSSLSTHTPPPYSLLYDPSQANNNFLVPSYPVITVKMTTDETTTNNKKYFDALASSYDNRHEKTINELIEHIRKLKDFIGVDWADGGEGDKKAVRLLDYACGTGLVSRALAQYVTQSVGVDISDNMVGAYNARAENQGLTKDVMHAYPGNLLDRENPDPPSLADPLFSNFDVAAVGLGAHHFADPDFAAAQLARRLRPGGVLFIVDFLPHRRAVAGEEHPAEHTVEHHGFSEERVRAMFEGAGAGKGFALAEMGDGVVFHGINKDGKTLERRVFIARGEKA